MMPVDEVYLLRYFKQLPSAQRVVSLSLYPAKDILSDRVSDDVRATHKFQSVKYIYVHIGSLFFFI